MIRYITIENNGVERIRALMSEIDDAGLFDEELRLFYPRHRCIYTEDLCFITRWCEVVHDDEVNDDNVFFKPTKWAIQTKNFRR